MLRFICAPLSSSHLLLPISPWLMVVCNVVGGIVCCWSWLVCSGSWYICWCMLSYLFLFASYFPFAFGWYRVSASYGHLCFLGILLLTLLLLIFLMSIFNILIYLLVYIVLFILLCQVISACLWFISCPFHMSVLFPGCSCTYAFFIGSLGVNFSILWWLYSWLTVYKVIRYPSPPTVPC